MKEFHKMTLVGVGKTGYQVLTEQLLDKQTDRVSYACTVILARLVKIVTYVATLVLSYLLG